VFHGQTVAAIIPALDEAATIGRVVAAIDRDLVDAVVVADNGSRDATADRAREAGALVVVEPRRGYGSACLRAVAAVPAAGILIFLDGDGSDDPAEIPHLLAPLADGEVDLVVGSRVLGESEPGALTPTQVLGNRLTCTLVRWLWGARFTDLGPFRAIRRAAYERLDMNDPDFGWTIEMQVKAAQRGLRAIEVPVTCRTRRGGRSKVSGTVLGSWRAGRRILGYVVAARWREIRGRAPEPAARGARSAASVRRAEDGGR
jgi:glycosyltransferase involved in cell wall biosynthesis